MWALSQPYVGMLGIEPGTFCRQGRRSAVELRPSIASRGGYGITNVLVFEVLRRTRAPSCFPNRHRWRRDRHLSSIYVQLIERQERLSDKVDQSVPAYLTQQLRIASGSEMTEYEGASGVQPSESPAAETAALQALKAENSVLLLSAAPASGRRNYLKCPISKILAGILCFRDLTLSCPTLKFPFPFHPPFLTAVCHQLSSPQSRPIETNRDD